MERLKKLMCMVLCLSIYFSSTGMRKSCVYAVDPKGDDAQCAEQEPQKESTFWDKVKEYGECAVGLVEFTMLLIGGRLLFTPPQQTKVLQKLMNQTKNPLMFKSDAISRMDLIHTTKTFSL